MYFTQADRKAPRGRVARSADSGKRGLDYRGSVIYDAAQCSSDVRQKKGESYDLQPSDKLAGQ